MEPWNNEEISLVWLNNMQLAKVQCVHIETFQCKMSDCFFHCNFTVAMATTQFENSLVDTPS